MTLKKILLSIAGCLGILGTLLPWYKASIFGITATSNAFGMGGALYVILAIVIILCSAVVILSNVMKEKQIKNIIKIKNFDLNKIPLFAGIAITAAAVIAFIAIKSESQGFGGTSWGIWLIGLAGVAIIVLPFLKNVKQLDKVVFGQPEKAEKAEKTEKKEAAKKK